MRETVDDILRDLTAQAPPERPRRGEYEITTRWGTLTTTQVVDLMGKLGDQWPGDPNAKYYAAADLLSGEGSATCIAELLDEQHRVTLPAATIRQWARRGKIEQLSGRRYRFGDVVHCYFYGDLRASRYSMA